MENRLEHHLGRDQMSIAINELLQNEQNHEIYFGQLLADMAELEFVKKNYKQTKELILKSYEIFLKAIKNREILLEVNNQNNLGVNDNV